MGTHKILAGAFGVLIVTGVAAVAIQERGNSRLEARIADLQTRAQEIGGLRQENLSLSKSLDEVRRLQNASRDGGVIAAKLKALRAENAALKRNISATVAHQPGDMAGNASSGGSNPPALNKLPRPVMQPRPEYPSDMRAQRTAGQVVVDFIVDATGNVQNAYSLSSTQREFEQSAVAAVSLWKFNPGQVGAHKINTHMQVPVVFSIGNQGADTASAPTPATSPAPDSPNGWFSGGQEVVTLVPFTVQAD
jgi:TonB family protein